MIRDFVVFVVRFQECLWRGPVPCYTCLSLMSWAASSSTSSLVLQATALCWSVSSPGAENVAGIFRFVLGILAIALWFRGRQGWEAWHHPVPFMGAAHAAGFFVAVRLFGCRRDRGLGISAKVRLFASSLCLWVSLFSEWCFLFSSCYSCIAFLDISPLKSDCAALTFVRS